MLRGKEEAADVVQDVFLSLWRRKGEIEISPYLKTYLQTSVRYKAIHILKRELPAVIIFWEKNLDSTTPVAAVQPNDVKAPDKTKATITLADSRMFYLDSAGKGTLATIEGATIEKNSKGAVVYKSNDDGQPQINTLTIRGEAS